MDTTATSDNSDEREPRPSTGERRIAVALHVIAAAQGILGAMTLVAHATGRAIPAAIAAAGIALSLTEKTLKAWQLRQR